MTLEAHRDCVCSAVFSGDGALVLTASADGTAKVWSVKTGACTLTLAGHRDSVELAVFSDDGFSVLTASGDGTAKLWSVETGACTLTLSGHRHWVGSAVFLRNGIPSGAKVVDRTPKRRRLVGKQPG